MNPLFTLGEEFRFHDSSRFRKKAGDAKLPFYHNFVPVLMSLAAESCWSREESVHLLKPPYLQWGKGWKSSTLWLQATPQETARCARWCHWTVRFVWCPFLGLERYIEFGLPKAVLPSKKKKVMKRDAQHRSYEPHHVSRLLFHPSFFV